MSGSNFSLQCHQRDASKHYGGLKTIITNSAPPTDDDVQAFESSRRSISYLKDIDRGTGSRGIGRV